MSTSLLSFRARSQSHAFRLVFFSSFISFALLLNEWYEWVRCSRSSIALSEREIGHHHSEWEFERENADFCDVFFFVQNYLPLSVRLKLCYLFNHSWIISVLDQLLLVFAAFFRFFFSLPFSPIGTMSMTRLFVSQCSLSKLSLKSN